LTQSADTRTVYVSSSSGSDTNSGLSQTAPVKTVSKGYSLLRSGYPDWLLLKRGDTWVFGDGIDGLGRVAGAAYFEKTGRSATEKMVISTYGSGARPYIKSMGAHRVIYPFNSTQFSHVAIVGLDCKNVTRDPSDPGYTGTAGAEAVRIGYCDDILIEDCRFSFYAYGASITSYGGPETRANVNFRRCVISDSYGVAGAHSQGIFAAYVDNLLVEECYFIHNGWHATLAPADVFNRNLYIANCTGTTMKGCVDADGASGGTQLRKGGLCEENLFVQNPSNVSIGHPQLASGTYASGAIRRNVILGSRNIGTDPRGMGIEIGQRVRGFELSDNIIAHNVLGTGNESAISTTYSAYWAGENEASSNINIHDNIVYDWTKDSTDGFSMSFVANPDGLTGVSIHDNAFIEASTGARVFRSTVAIPGVSFHNNNYYTPRRADLWFAVNGIDYGFTQWASAFSDSGSATTVPQYPDPNRTIESYMTSLGLTSTVDAFLALARDQSRDNWRAEFEARAVMNYVREGFGRPALAR
jgi:hypothetical protein